MKMGTSPWRYDAVAEHAGLAEHTPHGDATKRFELIAQELGKAVAGNRPQTCTPPALVHPVVACGVRSGHRFQNPCDGMRNAWLKREDAFCHAMIIVSSAMVSSS
jgi:hypothetical protein